MRRRLGPMLGALLLSGCALSNALDEPPRQDPDAGTTDTDDPDTCGGLALDGFQCVPSGSFFRGSPPDEEGRDDDEVLHQVTITRDFLIHTTEVTQAGWTRFFTLPPGNLEGCDDCPVVLVSWYETLAYANARSAEDGLPACYTLEDCSGTFAGGCTVEQCDGYYVCALVRFAGPECEGYRVPTEAEWEMAARAGTDSPRYDAAEVAAWYDLNSDLHLHPVAQKEPNDLGLVDMLGNAQEWTLDGYGAYPPGPLIDPTGSQDNLPRVVRGGSFFLSERMARAAWRNALSPDTRRWDTGFRLVRTAPRPEMPEEP